MGQKHNRRRTRPRPRNRYSLQLQQQQLPVIAEDDAFYYSNAANYTYHSRSSSSSSSLSSTSSSASLMTPLLGPAMLPHALPWHHRYPTWQNQEQEQQKQEQSYHDKAATLEEERYRLFGGEPGDDIALCYRMLEYFGGLDFINT